MNNGNLNKYKQSGPECIPIYYTLIIWLTQEIWKPFVLYITYAFYE